MRCPGPRSESCGFREKEKRSAGFFVASGDKLVLRTLFTLLHGVFVKLNLGAIQPSFGSFEGFSRGAAQGGQDRQCKGGHKE